MAVQRSIYITQTGMPVDTGHAYFNLPGADKIFPPIKANSYIPIQEALAKGNIDPQTKLMLFPVGDITIALLFKQMAFHHVAQGQIQGIEWAAVFCACCNMGAAFKPIIDGKVHHFSGTGVYHGMVIMRDKETGSYWEHALGECIHGTLQGKQLEIIPAQYLLAEQLLETAPTALLVTAKQPWWQWLLDTLLMKDMLTPKGHMPAPFRLSMGKRDERLPEMQLGLGVWGNGKARFYAMNTIQAHGNALIDEKQVIFIDPLAQVPIVYHTDATSCTWDGDTLVLDTGEHIRNGYVETSGSGKKRIDGNHQQFIRWFAFSFKFPGCEIYGYQ